jgi:hypothetical protein
VGSSSRAGAGGCPEEGKFRFGTAFSSADTLSLAVSHAMRQAVEQLDGAPPHLCQVSQPRHLPAPAPPQPTSEFVSQMQRHCLAAGDVRSIHLGFHAPEGTHMPLTRELRLVEAGGGPARVIIDRRLASREDCVCGWSMNCRTRG